jgi:uncharacterized membrane protein
MSAVAVGRSRRGLRPRVPSVVRREPLLMLLVVGAAAAYATYSVWKHANLGSDFDLAIADQGVWHISRLQPPWSTLLVSQNVLGDHFSPLVGVLAPLFWIWDDARMLLIAQGALLAGSIIPVFLYVQPRIGRLGAYLMSAAYALFWGFSAAVGYNFHELCFSPILLASAILFADRERWRAFAITVGLLLLVKENMGMLVFFLGLWLMTRSELRRGAITAVAGVAWFVLATQVLIPAFSSRGGYIHWDYYAFGHNLGEAVTNLLRHPSIPFDELVSVPDRLVTILYLFAPFLALVVFSPLVILCVPLVAQQVFSNDAGHWARSFHYWMTIAPVLAMGSADGLRNIVRLAGRRPPAPVLGAAVAATILFANVLLAQRFPLWDLAKPGFTFQQSRSTRAALRALDTVPSDRSLVTVIYLLPHASHRNDLYLLGGGVPATEYVVYPPGRLGFPDPAYAEGWLKAHRRYYRKVYDRDGWVVLKRRS